MGVDVLERLQQNLLVLRLRREVQPCGLLGRGLRLCLLLRGTLLVLPPLIQAGLMLLDRLPLAGDRLLLLLERLPFSVGLSVGPSLGPGLSLGSLRLIRIWGQRLVQRVGGCVWCRGLRSFYFPGRLCRLFFGHFGSHKSPFH